MLQTEATNTVAFRRWVASFSPDLGVVAAFGHILGKKALAVPRLGCVNVHASLLPRWRGASPIQMAVLHGDRVAGISLMRMDEGMDTGPVYKTASLEVAADETGQSLHDRLAVLGGELLVSTLPLVESGVEPTPQPTDGVTLAPLI
ncbi:MAG TPA: methionyl-tRNA formyltransferase, partial [Myxococcota bacterium]|nr:methionyl-tRNA formyltransferase [Myxococcota bacterium]